MTKPIITLEQIQANAQIVGKNLSEEYLEVFTRFLDFYKSKSKVGLNILFRNLGDSPGDLTQREDPIVYYTHSGGGWSRNITGYEITLNLNQMKNAFDLELTLYHELAHAFGSGCSLQITSVSEMNQEFYKTYKVYTKEIVKHIIVLFCLLGLSFKFPVFFLITIVYGWYLKNKINYYNLTYQSLRYNYLTELNCDKYAFNNSILKNKYQLENTFLGDKKITKQKKSHPSGEMRIQFLRDQQLPQYPVLPEYFLDTVSQEHARQVKANNKFKRIKIELFLLINNLLSWIKLN